MQITRHQSHRKTTDLGSNSLNRSLKPIYLSLYSIQFMNVVEFEFPRVGFCGWDLVYSFVSVRVCPLLISFRISVRIVNSGLVLVPVW